MKQLLHSAGPHLVAALGERAFAAISSTLSSLSSPVDVVELAPTPLGTGAGDTSKGNPVLAVATSLTSNGTKLLVAAARQDKTLALYSIDQASLSAAKTEKSAMGMARPTTVYKTHKRVGSLLFATVPGKSLEALDVLIAGDFEGSVIAYPIPSLDAEVPGENVSRLLLGHTTSILTGLRMVKGADGNSKILTSDNDEKVRVSSFPNTFIVEGYLLGHTDCVTSLDAATDASCPYCVTCGGDGTIRLWNYLSFEQIALIEIEIEEERGSDDDKKIPTSVGMSADGSIIVVSWHGSNFADVYKVTKCDGASASLQKIQALECPQQPLVVAFLTDGSLCFLAKDPAYLMRFEPTRNDAGEITSFLSVTDACGMCTSLKEIGAAGNIDMPASILEEDDLTGKLALRRKMDNVQDVRKKEWNNIKRKEINKNRNIRRKKRQRERAQLDKSETN